MKASQLMVIIGAIGASAAMGVDTLDESEIPEALRVKLEAGIATFKRIKSAV